MKLLAATVKCYTNRKSKTGRAKLLTLMHPKLTSVQKAESFVASSLAINNANELVKGLK